MSYGSKNCKVHTDTDQQKKNQMTQGRYTGVKSIEWGISAVENLNDYNLSI